MAQNHIDQVLKTAGLPEDQIKALKELPDETKDFKPEAYIAPIKTAFETQVKNDPKFYEGLNEENLPTEFVEKLVAKNYGAAAGKVRHHMLKAVGLSEKDFSDLGDDFKKMEVFTPAFVKKLSEGKVGDKELQAKLIEANTELEKLKGEIPGIETKFKSDYESKVNDFTINQNILTILASVPGLKAPAKWVSDGVIKDLKSKYAFAVENGNVELRQKDKPTLKPLTDHNTKELTLTDAINQMLEAGDLIDKKKSSVITPGPTNVNAGPSGLKLPKHVNDKSNKLIADQAKQ